MLVYDIIFCPYSRDAKVGPVNLHLITLQAVGGGVMQKFERHHLSELQRTDFGWIAAREGKLHVLLAVECEFEVAILQAPEQWIFVGVAYSTGYAEPILIRQFLPQVASNVIYDKNKR